jgi:drug/metabolite transporter (DMT)-like permease
MFRPGALPYLWMLCGAASFAMMSFLAAGLKDDLDWQWIAIARTGLAMIFAAGLAVAGGAKLVLFRPAKLWMRSIAGSVSLVCGFYAMTHYPVSEVLTLTNMFPLWVAVLSLPLLGEWPPFDVWPAVVIGVVGVVLIQSAGGQQPSGSGLAVGLAVASSFLSAVALIGLHHVRELDPRAIVAHFSAVALACSLLALLLPGTKPPVIGLATGVALLGMGLFATVGQLCLTKAFATGPPARVSVVGLTQVGFSMLLEMSISHRTFSRLTLLGIALIVAPTAWSLLRASRSVKEIPMEEPV